jgi:hypothetical protein
LAAQEGNVKIVDFLLNAGAAFSTNISGLTFVDIAIMQKQISILFTIIAHERYLHRALKPFRQKQQN